MLAYERHGSGEALVLVHGVTHRRQAWYPVLERLTAHREVFLVDLPGHGESGPFRPGEHSVPEALSIEFRSFLAALGIERPHVAGYSLGGRIALEAGARGDARSVTAFSPAGFWRGPAEFAYTRRIFTSAARLLDRLGPHAELLAHSRAGRHLMYGILMRHPSRVPADHALGDVRGFAYARAALGEILDAATPFTATIAADVPVTVAWSACDLVLPPRQAAVAQRALPRAEHLMMPGVGHVPVWDDPDRVAELILRGSGSRSDTGGLPSRRAPARVRPAS